MIIGAAVALAVVALVIGMAVAFAFGLSAMLGFQLLGQDLTAFPSIIYSGVDSFPLMAVPFFLFTGILMKDAGISRRLVEFISSFTRRIAGSTGLTVVYTSALFGAISGSSVATVSAMGSILSPEMRREGYPSSYIGALTAVSGTLGILIPPSIPMVVYGIATGTSIGDLFLSGITAGLLLVLALTIIHLITVRRTMPAVVALSKKSETPADRKRLSLFRTTGPALPALTLPVIILGGIYGGVFTPTEAGAVASVCAIMLAFFVYRSMRVGQFYKAVRDSALATAGLLIILAIGTAFARFLTLSRANADLAEFVASYASSKWLFLILANLVIAAVALFVEENTTIIILAPLLVPIAVQLGIDPVHFGTIMVVNMGISLSTPPMAPNLFVAARACNASFSAMTAPTLRFLIFGAVPVLILVNAFPEMVLFFR
jgi:C4-dicarboxylate transporter DctM subunit